LTGSNDSQIIPTNLRDLWTKTLRLHLHWHIHSCHSDYEITFLFHFPDVIDWLIRILPDSHRKQWEGLIQDETPGVRIMNRLR
jgi:hypothetical protein